MTLPATVTIDAWTGESSATAPFDDGAAGWGLTPHARSVSQPLAAEPPDLREWSDPAVGWGLVLRDDDALSTTDRASGADAPEPIRALLASRKGAVVLRWRDGHSYLLRYFATGRPAKVQMGGAGPRGMNGGDTLPFYLLIYASPADIPWSVQYVLNQACFVGRLDLKGEALERYVGSLMAGWKDSTCHATQPVVWATDDGSGDITGLMRRSIAEPLYTKLAADSDIGDKARLLAGADATSAALTSHLNDRKPALVVSTSHGLTEPLDNPPAMAARLGALVDVAKQVLDPAALLGTWQPDGAIWYCHACCSAGGDSSTSYDGLTPAGSPVDRVLRAVAAGGATIAPLPTALLGAQRPLRAFIGHVEPTFDWTLRAPDTGQMLTTAIVQAIYDGLHQKIPETVGMAFQRSFRIVGQLLGQWMQMRQDVVRNVPQAEIAALRLQLAALDRQGMVILGDPTVSPPALSAA
jgi:hypothetical protein